ncbi:MAG: DUF4493 domain-containing protein [Mucinivorans sp.]
MKKYLLMLSFVALMFGCNNDTEPVGTAPSPEGQKGKVSFTISPDDMFVVTTSKSAAPKSAQSKAASGVPAAADFAISILRADGSVYASYAKFSEMPQILEMPKGNYKVVASHGENLEAKMENPYYYGEKAFTITTYELTNIELVCQMANVKVSIVFSEESKNSINNLTAVVHTGSNEASGILNFLPTTTTSGFFAVPASGKLFVNVSGILKADGSSIAESIVLSNVVARQWHKINISIKPVGEGTFTFTIDPTLIEKNSDITIPEGGDIIDNGGDQGNWKPGDVNPPVDPPVDPVAPIAVAGVYGTTPFLLKDVQNLSSKDFTHQTVLNMNITASKKIKSLDVTIISAALPQTDLNGMGLTAPFSMTSPTFLAATSLGAFGLLPVPPAAEADFPSYNTGIKGQTAYTFGIGSFLSMLASVQGTEKTMTHQFKLDITDEANNTFTTTLTLNITL